MVNYEREGDKCLIGTLLMLIAHQARLMGLPSILDFTVYDRSAEATGIVILAFRCLIVS